MLGRLHKTAEFERVRSEGKRRRGTYCNLNFAPHIPAAANDPLTRVGYITSKKVGNAVQRNRTRRLMREAMRDLARHITTGWDIVLIAHPTMAQPTLKMQNVRKELEWLLKQASILTSTPTSSLVPSPTPTVMPDNQSSKFLPAAALPGES